MAGLNKPRESEFRVVLPHKFNNQNLFTDSIPLTVVDVPVRVYQIIKGKLELTSYKYTVKIFPSYEDRYTKLETAGVFDLTLT